MIVRFKPMALWSRNVIGAVVAAIALGVMTATQLYPQWSDYREKVVPAHVVPRKAALDVYGQTWQLGSIRRFTTLPKTTADRLPPDTVLFVVTIDRSGSPSVGYCVGVAVDGQRQWRDQGVGAFGVRAPDGTASGCAHPGPLQFTFLLPSDSEPTAVDITRGDTRILLRLML
jgi:hypothetical protein